MRIRNKFISKNKNYNFLFKKQRMLKLENKFFAHITNSNLIAMHIKNIFFKFFVILKNLKIDQLKNFFEKKCYLTDSKQRYLTIMIDKIDLKKILQTKTMFQNEVIVYKNEFAVKKIFTMIENYSKFFKII